MPESIEDETRDWIQFHLIDSNKVLPLFLSRSLILNEDFLLSFFCGGFKIIWQGGTATRPFQELSVVFLAALSNANSPVIDGKLQF